MSCSSTLERPPKMFVHRSVELLQEQGIEDSITGRNRISSPLENGSKLPTSFHSKPIKTAQNAYDSDPEVMTNVLSYLRNRIFLFYIILHLLLISYSSWFQIESQIVPHTKATMPVQRLNETSKSMKVSEGNPEVPMTQVKNNLQEEETGGSFARETIYKSPLPVNLGNSHWVHLSLETGCFVTTRQLERALSPTPHLLSFCLQATDLCCLRITFNRG